MQAVQALHLILPTFELNNANSLPAAQQTLGNTGGNAGPRTGSRTCTS